MTGWRPRSASSSRGGFETTGHSIAWALLMISQHATVEARVLAELRALHLLPHQAARRSLEFEDLARLTYTGQAIKARPPGVPPSCLRAHRVPTWRLARAFRRRCG